MVFIRFCPVLCFYTNDFPPITLYTADTSWIPTGVCSPGKYPCSPVLLPYRFSKYAQSDAPPGTNHPAEIRPQFPYLWSPQSYMQAWYSCCNPVGSSPLFPDKFFHLVKCFYILQFPCKGIFTSKSHYQQGKTVPIHQIHSMILSIICLSFAGNKHLWGFLKIEERFLQIINST